MCNDDYQMDRAEANMPDFYVYDKMPVELRGKIRFSILDCLERAQKRLSYGVHASSLVSGLVSRALGRVIGDGSPLDFEKFLMAAALADLLRGIEATLEGLCRMASMQQDQGLWDEVTSLAEDLNKLFGHFRFGYRIEALGSAGADEPVLQLVRIDSEFTHKEMVRPTLWLLQRKGFDTAAQQFSDALAEFTDGHYEDAITDANSSFESTLKKVLNRKDGSAAELIKAAQEKGYVPQYLDDSMVHYGKLLQALPTVRHREGDAHGKLQRSADVERFARYAIHLAAANIIFIMNAYK